ncbi:histidine kinase [Actinoplanes sp. NBC_00393]|uniref:sensor histidine kinase n=1 Tax=Actinoplanes sp. NBC_00393 TaxID=2975953 RepID=UPI002E1B76E1
MTERPDHPPAGQDQASLALNPAAPGRPNPSQPTPQAVAPQAVDARNAKGAEAAVQQAVNVREAEGSEAVVQQAVDAREAERSDAVARQAVEARDVERPEAGARQAMNARGMEGAEAAVLEGSAWESGGATGERAGRMARLRAAARYRAVDVLAILVSWFFALVLVGEAESIGRISSGEVLPLLALGWVTSLAVWWRRSHPVAMALIIAPVGLVTDASAYAGLVIVYTLVTLRRGRVVALIVLLHLLIGVGYSWRRPDPTLALPLLTELLLSAALIAATVAIAVAVRSRRELIVSLRERAVRAEEAARLRAERLRALERESIAREMHDALAHRISMVSLHAGALQIRPDLSPEEVAKAAGTIRDSAHHALEDLREILGVLRAGAGDGLRPQPDLGHLGDLVAEAQNAGVRVEVSNFLDDGNGGGSGNGGGVGNGGVGRGGEAVGPSLGRTVYRLVQEGLTNAGKHAPGVPVRLVLEKTALGELHVEISNPLPGTPAAGVPGAGAGLVGLAERVELLGGRLRHGVRADPRTGLGFHLEAWLPWQN